MNPLILLAAAVLMGLAVALAAWAGRDWLRQKFRRDQQWMRETYLRFQPEPINAPLYVIFYYAGYVALAIALLVVIPSLPVVIVLWVASLFVPRWFVAWRWRLRN